MRVRRAVAEMGSYNPPLEMRVEQDYLLLDFSESTIPPSPAVIGAMQDYLASGKLQIYPAYGDLATKLARYVGVAPEQLLLTNGSDGAIQLIEQSILEPGDEIVIPKPYFHVIGATAQSLGATLICPPYRADLSFPFEEVIAAVTPKTRMIVVVTPNNPTGTSATLEQIETLLKRYPDIAIFVDEAYYEFSGQTCVALLAKYENLVISRTFSKAMAMAGLRFGYAISNPAYIRELHKLRIPYDVNSLAVVAAAASLDNPGPWQAHVREVMERAKPLVERFFAEHRVPFVKSDCNFMLVKDPDPNAVFEYLMARGILIRPQRQTPEYFRVSLGTVAEMQRFMQVFSEYLEQSRAAASTNSLSSRPGASRPAAHSKPA